MNLLDAISSAFSTAPEEPEEPTVIRNDASCCNHGHGEPDNTFYFESSSGYGKDKTWTFTARDKYECLNCGAEITAKRELGVVAMDDDENLVVLDE